MTILRTKDIRKFNEKEMNKKLHELRLELAKERANVSVGGTVSSPGRLKEIKRTIARITAIQAERPLSAKEGKR